MLKKKHPREGFTPLSIDVTFTESGRREPARRVYKLVASIEERLRATRNISPYFRTPRHHRFIKVASRILSGRKLMFPAESVVKEVV